MTMQSLLTEPGRVDLQKLREALARAEVEELAARIDWNGASPPLPMPQEWLDETDNPFEPESAP